MYRRITQTCGQKGFAGAGSEECGRQLRIGLVSPYTGGNLGDAAIIESARVHLKRLFPNAEFLLIVLDCERVSRQHGLECFPLAAAERPFYFTSPRKWSEDVHKRNGSFECGDAVTSSRLRSVLKKTAGNIPFALSLARRARDMSQTIELEGRHLREAARAVGSLDGLIVAGGGQFDDEFGGAFGHPYAMFKWISLAHREGVPVFFAGVGVCEVTTKLTSWFLRRAAAKSRFISLRDEGSLRILGRLVVRRDLRHCPDLAFGLHDNKTGVNLLGQRASRLHIGLSPIAFGRPKSWPTENPASFDRYWNQFKALCAELVRAGYWVSLFATDDSDIGLVKEVHGHLMEIASGNEQLRPLPTSNFTELLCAMPGFDAVIASRLHGVLLSHITGVPVLAISYHRKVRAHMEDMGQQKFCMDFEHFDAPRAIDCLTDLLAQRSAIVSEIRGACAARYKAVEREFAIIGRELSSNRKNSYRG